MGKKRKILVVDDEINVCKSLQKAIISEDYDVDTALSGEEAIKKDEKKHYDLVITDLMMPGISGMDLLISLKTSRPEVIVIVVTGYPSIKTAVLSIKIGAFDYISKPFTPDELRGVVFRAFKSTVSEKGKGKRGVEPVMPADLFLMRGHTWLRREKKNLVTIGVVYDFIKHLGKIANLELPEENTNIFQGEACARLTDTERHIHRVWSPATGRIVKINKKLGDDLSLLMEDPYQKGWLLQIESPNMEKDLEHLISSK